MARRRGIGPESLGVVILRGNDARAPAPVAAPPVSAQDWETAVGTKIARRARPVKLERGVLHVRTATSTWAQELSLLADRIVEQLRARGMNVKSLRFQVGPVEPIARPAWRSDVRVTAPPAPIPPEIKAILARTHDAGLRDAIARAMAVSLGQANAETASTSPRSNAPSPQSSAPQTAPRDQTKTARREAPRDTRGGSSRRGS